MDIKQQTQNVANQGRYGDSMLLHVNPAEVKGLAQAMPITVNPETGQPEAFLPFLAPLLGSMAGTALFGGSALAAGIGAGLATYAQTGGSGSKALLSGLTAGFGTSAMNTAAQTAQTGSDIAAGVAGGMSPELAAQTAAATPRATTGVFQSGKDLFMQGGSGVSGGTGGTFAFDQGAKSLANAAMSPSGMMAGTALGGRSIINSQELYEQQMRQFEEDEEQRRRDMYANNPEVQLYSASGGTTNFEGGGLLEKTLSGDYGVLGILKNNPELAFGAAGLAAKNNFRGSFLGELYNKYKERKSQGDEQGANEVASQIQQEESNQMAYGGMTNFARGGDTDDYGSESGKQVFAPAKQQYAVNPNFMAGFAPETMYFRPDTINAEARSSTHGMRPELGRDTYTGTKGGYDYEGYLDNEGNYVAGTAQGVQFAPQTAIDPYAAYTGIAPDGVTPLPPFQGLVQSEYNPYDVMARILPPEGSSGSGGSGYNNTSTWLENEEDDARYAEETKGQGGGYRDRADEDQSSSVQQYVAGGPTEVLPMGGMSEQPMQDPLIQEVIAFLMGDSENTEVVEMFVDKYGNETFMALREMILNPDGTKQTEGLIAGVGNGGMDDDLLGSIGNKEKIAVSQDEFIIPADVVSGLGDGSSNAGSKELYAMMDRIRQKRTGTTKQPTMLANAGGLLPA
jgi:hypothetical protein